jgi:E3 ubiquitin-protein ligase HERC4
MKLTFDNLSGRNSLSLSVVGILCGLAIYNFTIINIPFPLAMYKKLLNEPVKLQDMKELSPIVAKYVNHSGTCKSFLSRCRRYINVLVILIFRSLEDVLNYNEPDLEEVFNLHFAFTRDVFGEVKVIPLKPDGEKIPVTLENKYAITRISLEQSIAYNTVIKRSYFVFRHEFVELYVDMILNKLVETRFNQFSAGFHKVCGGRVLKLFHAQELMSVVIGTFTSNVSEAWKFSKIRRHEFLL